MGGEFGAFPLLMLIPSTQHDADAASAESILVQLSEAEFDRGLDALSNFAKNATAGPVVELVDSFVFRKVER